MMAGVEGHPLGLGSHNLIWLADSFPLVMEFFPSLG